MRHYDKNDPAGIVMKSLFCFSFTRLDDMLAKGNVWYARNYECYFDKAYIIYLSGNPHEPIVNGNTVLISLGIGNGLLSLLAAPFRLCKLAERLKPTDFLSADQVFLWWTSLAVRIFLKARVVLMPVCMPEVIYRISKRSLSGLPFWIERKFIFLSFLSAEKILTAYGCGALVGWLRKNSHARDKLCVVDTLTELLSTESFFNRMKKGGGHYFKNDFFNLVYVGRLHSEKLVRDLVVIMSQIAENTTLEKPAILHIVGDGTERDSLEKLSVKLNVEDRIRFIGYIPNERVPDYLFGADVFVSTLTGTALREAALCGVPIVVYEMDWVAGLLKHEDTALLVAPGDTRGMANEIIRLLKDRELSSRISDNAKNLAGRLWSPAGLRGSLSQVFGR